MNTIRFEIPSDAPLVLKATAAYLLEQAGEAPAALDPLTTVDPESPVSKATPAADPAKVFAEPATAPESATAEPDAPETPEAEPEQPSAPAGVDVDSEGLPWDSRIHSSNKKKLQKTGAWQLKRGVDPALATAVKAELAQAMAAPAATTDTPPPPAADPAAATTPPPPPAADALAPEFAAIEGFAMPATFPELVTAITRFAMGADKLTPALAASGLTDIGALGARPDLIPQVAKALFGAK